MALKYSAAEGGPGVLCELLYAAMAPERGLGETWVGRTPSEDLSLFIKSVINLHCVIFPGFSLLHSFNRVGLKSCLITQHFARWEPTATHSLDRIDNRSRDVWEMQIKCPRAVCVEGYAEWVCMSAEVGRYLHAHTVDIKPQQEQ